LDAYAKVDEQQLEAQVDFRKDVDHKGKAKLERDAEAGVGNQLREMCKFQESGCRYQWYSRRSEQRP
jgi:ribosome modulation factor